MNQTLEVVAWDCTGVLTVVAFFLHIQRPPLSIHFHAHLLNYLGESSRHYQSVNPVVSFFILAIVGVICQGLYEGSRKISAAM